MVIFDFETSGINFPGSDGERPNVRLLVVCGIRFVDGFQSFRRQPLHGNGNLDK